MTLVIRGRRRLLGVVAVAALVLALGYGWLAVTRGSNLAGWLCALTAAISIVHGLAFADARRAILEADETGIRVRVRRSVSRLDWTQVHEVVVQPARRLSDGVVEVTPVPAARTKAALVARFGWATSAAGADVAAVLRSLAGAKVRVVGQPVESTSTVVTTPATAVSPSADRGPRAEVAPARMAPARTTLPQTAPAKVAAALTTRRTGRRAELAVSLPTGSRSANVPTAGPATTPTDASGVDGSLALDPAKGATTLPERADLRRPNTDNISLIIDDTTAISAQAMSRARRPVVRRVEPADVEVTVDPDGDGDAPSEPPREPPSDARADVDGDAGAAQQPPGRLGPALAHARTLVGLSVEDLAERTRIRPHVIECLERNDVSACGGDVYARGHVRMLARALGLDPAPLIEQYDQTFASEPVPVRQVFEAELSTGNGGLIRTGGDGPKWGVLVGVVLVFVMVWTVARYLSDGTTANATTTQITNTKGLGSPGAGNRLLPGPARTSAVLRGVDGDSHVLVVDRYARHVFDGVLKAGQTRRVAGIAPLKIVAADGSVVGSTVNGKDRGLLAPVQTDGYQRHVLVPTTVTVRAHR